jgi:hypothetical protein
VPERRSHDNLRAGAASLFAAQVGFQPRDQAGASTVTAPWRRDMARNPL